jgi:hypothetical protein
MGLKEGESRNQEPYLCATIRHETKPENLTIDVYMEGTEMDRARKYLKKGKPINVAGELSVKTHQGKTYLRLRRARFWFVDSRPPEESKPKPRDIWDDDSVPEF